MFCIFPKLSGEDILPQVAIDLLPFSAEPLSQWNVASDLLTFLLTLRGNYPPEITKKEYFEGKKEAAIWINRFAKIGLEKTSFSIDDNNAIVTLNFWENALFGRAAKYTIAWDHCVSSVLEEDAFYSLAHVLESAEDIRCSTLLASHLYYKQALQVLRGFVEDLVLPIYFCENPQDFINWRASNYRTPQLRGKNGILRQLANKNVISGDIESKTSDLYGELSGPVHGSEKWLINQGVHTPDPRGFGFNYDVFCVWCEYFSRSVDLGIKLLKASYIQSERILSAKRQALAINGKVLCTSCYNEDDFDTELLSPKEEVILLPTSDGSFSRVDPSLPGIKIFHCRRCKRQISVTLPGMEYVSVVTMEEERITVNSGVEGVEI